MSQVKRHDEGGGHLSGVEASKKYDLPLGRNLYSTHTIDISGGDPILKAEAIRQYFHNTFEVFERVFDCIACDEGFYRPPKHRLRHPMIFYYGHTACFYVNKLVVAGLTTRINPKFEEMFAVGVDEMSWDDLNESHYTWPKVEEVKAYRVMVRDRINELITSGKFELQLPLSFDRSTDNDHNAFWWVMLMGIEHERIHLETASVHIREMDIALVKKNDFWDHCPESGEAPQNELVAVEGQKGVLVGRQLSDPEYGWDTDYSDNYRLDVAPFKASKFLVSNAEFLEFMKDGGYATQRFWDEEGWKWVSWRKPSHPYFWVPDGEDKYKLRVQTEEIPLPKNWPVDANWLEGRAFINWKSEKLGKRLRFPTEAEWLLMRDRFVGSQGDQHQWVAGKPPGNINMEVYRSSCPVDKFAHGPLYDVVGNTWQHIETPIYPYPGYKVHPFYDDFSLPTFDGRHSAMRGGAWISTGNEASRDARFGFRRHFFQCIGIRYIEGEEVNETKFLRNVLGLDPEVDALTDAAFGSGTAAIPNFGVALAEHAKTLFRAHAGTGASAARALDLFCGAGRTTFELTSDFAEVVGSDFSARKLIPGFSLRERGEATYSVIGSNGLREGRVVKAEAFPWAATRERATFFQADPTNLHPHMDNFDLIVACGVLERTYKPAAVPAHLASRLKSGGLLLIASTFAFDEEFAHRDSWLCGATADDARDPEAEVAALLAGIAEPIATAVDIVGYFPQRARLGQLRTYRVLAFRKK